MTMIEKLDGLIQEEFHTWQKEGLNPQALGVNSWFSHNEHIALVELLLEKEIITDEEINLKTRQVNLKALQEAREMFGSEVRKSQILQGVPGVQT